MSNVNKNLDREAAIKYTDVINCDLAGVFASDIAVVNAARISFDTEHQEMEKGDDQLIDFLLRNRHGTPFEHGYFKFCVEAPIFAFREHHRHRIGHSYNEMSGRYTELQPKFYLPTTARVQEGKPGAYTYEEEELGSDLTVFMRDEAMTSYRQSWYHYLRLLGSGIAKEQARIVLPVGIYTKMIWSCNPRSLMHFLGLRATRSAQKEIRVVAEAAEAAFAEAMPITYASFCANGRIAP